MLGFGFFRASRHWDHLRLGEEAARLHPPARRGCGSGFSPFFIVRFPLIMM
jgi:hypothetical protein